MKVLKFKVNKNILISIVILLSAFLNCVLRLSIESDMTLFRVFLPFAVIFLFFSFREYFNDFIITSSFMLLYFIFISILSVYKVNLGVFVFSLHYLTLVFLYFFIKAISENNGKSIFVFLKLVYYFMCLLGIFEYITEIKFPFIDLENNGVSTFFWGVNDYSAALAIMFPLLIYEKSKGLSKILKYIFLVIGFVFITYVNSSRLDVIAIIVYLSSYLYLKSKYIFFILIGLFFLFIFTLLASLKFGGDSLFELLLDPIEHIIMLKPYRINYGSVAVRTNAVVYSIHEFRNSYFLGIGPGNTIQMLENPKYFLHGAKSIHNFLLQMIVEGGMFSIIVYYWIIKKIKNEMKCYDYNGKVFYKAFLLSSMLMLTSLSVGAFSNYFFWIVFFFGLFHFKNINKL